MSINAYFSTIVGLFEQKPTDMCSFIPYEAELVVVHLTKLKIAELLREIVAFV